ncbi:tetratricopeptide repeat protein [Caldinitratiruptor microaerophilus]|uniref:Tetratricopeptide repeat protein n=1 Tax=Caldinitratiruptor microaerophilus TaxID=671077 RepID=A0AA35CPP5_9FIRM|nr:tetratricopeptide repeat protein [Caldinitratiruptor microaerophilus]BDG61857.1 hypothetical protein caldi_29470 [Caldinitratiruptor microaerophilus]
MSAGPADELRARADAAYAAGDLDRAADLYRRVLADHPDDVHALSRTGAILAQTGDLDGAERALRRALAVDPMHAPAHSNLGNVLYTRGDYAGALACYQKAAALDPGSPIYHDNLHAAYKRLGRIGEAVAAYRRARRLEAARRAAADVPAGRGGGRPAAGCLPGLLLVFAAVAFLMASAS